MERAAKLEWAIDHYHSSREAQEFVDQDAQSFAVEMSSRILEKGSELKTQNAVPGEAAGGEISSPGDEIARRRLSEGHRGAERSESGR